jgi:glucose/arabinose dehydrogenase
LFPDICFSPGLVSYIYIKTRDEMVNRYYALFFMMLLIYLGGCYQLRPSDGGGQVKKPAKRSISPEDIALPDGYRIEAVATDLTFPAALTFDEQGQIYVVESGYSYGEAFTGPQLIKIGKDGQKTVIAKGEKNGPWNGVTFHDGSFYVVEGGILEGGRILRVSRDGNITVLVDGLPSYGDHHTDGLVIHNGYLYFSQGTATNAGVVGKDNYDYGWLSRNPQFHDTPCKDVVLLGKNYESSNVLNNEEGKVQTGAFVPYGTPTSEGQIIRGELPCSGALFRVPLQGGQMELIAWGFRNPFGIAVRNDKIFITDNAFDVRGSRPAWGSGDVLWEVQHGMWYGWPDFSGGMPIEMFKPPGKAKPEPVLKEHPNNPPKPVATLGVHSSSNGIDFSKNEEFGWKGKAFIAQFGDMAPQVGKVMAPVGYKVIMVDTETGVVTDFAVNKGRKNGPASYQNAGGFERPVSLKFNESGDALYVVDFGVMRVTKKGSYPEKNTGVIWKITKK